MKKFYLVFLFLFNIVFSPATFGEETEEEVADIEYVIIGATRNYVYMQRAKFFGQLEELHGPFELEINLTEGLFDLKSLQLSWNNKKQEYDVSLIPEMKNVDIQFISSGVTIVSTDPKINEKWMFSIDLSYGDFIEDCGYDSETGKGWFDPRNSLSLQLYPDGRLNWFQYELKQDCDFVTVGSSYNN